MKIKYFLFGLLALILGAGFYICLSGAASAQSSDIPDHLFKNPFKVRIDAKNNLVFVLNNSEGITVLDAKDYSFVRRILKNSKIQDAFIDAGNNKVYAIDNSKNIYVIELLNNGIGPALIKSFQIQLW